MALVRRSLLILLLVTVPFQAALGATGLRCAASAHPTEDAASALHDHVGDATRGHDHVHVAGVAGKHYDSIADPGWHESHGPSGKCKVCSECCFSPAAIPGNPPGVFAPDSPVRVSSFVEPVFDSRPGDGLFRPPRATSA